MQSYELTIVLPGKSSTAKKKAAQTSLEKIVKTLKGKLGKVEDWGEKRLSYEIAGNDSGVFLHFPLELEPDSAKTIVGKLKFEEDIIRYLLIKK